MADALVAEDTAGLLAVVAGGHVQIRMTDAAEFHFHQRFAGGQGAQFPFDHFHIAGHLLIDHYRLNFHIAYLVKLVETAVFSFLAAGPD